MYFDMYMLCLIIVGMLVYPLYWLVRWCRALMGTWVEPPPPPDRSTLRRPEVDPEWEADYGHVRHE
jgi:hypothetical protein